MILNGLVVIFSMKKVEPSKRKQYVLKWGTSIFWGLFLPDIDPNNNKYSASQYLFPQKN